MSLKYLWNKLEKMNSLEQQAYIENIFKQFDITPYYPIADNFKNIPGKQSQSKNPLGYIVMHLQLDQLMQLIPEYYRELLPSSSFKTVGQLDILIIIQDVVSAIKEHDTDSLPGLSNQNTEEMLEVFEFGVGKYHPWSFLDLNPYTLVPALFRHLYKYHYISKTDEETNVSHLAHAACNIRMIQLIIERGEQHV
jgi:hypothetical protein